MMLFAPLDIPMVHRYQWYHWQPKNVKGFPVTIAMEVLPLGEPRTYPLSLLVEKDQQCGGNTAVKKDLQLSRRFFSSFKCYFPLKF